MARISFKRLAAEHEEFERALRIRIWNECKGRGEMDAMAYRIINDTISALKANAARAIEAGTAETVKQGSVHESADPKGRAQDVSRSNEEGE